MAIPVVTVTLEAMQADLERRIQACKERYRMSSEKMSRQLSEGQVQETEELLEWMQAYHVRQSLKGTTPTTGIPGITTGISTNGG